MPPPSYCSEFSTRSSGDHEPEIENDIDHSTAETANCEEKSFDGDSHFIQKYDSVSIVKSLLGPSLDNTVLKTLEFGKSLIQKADENETKKMLRHTNKKDALMDSQNQGCGFLTEQEYKRELSNDCKNSIESRATRKRLVYTSEMEKDTYLCPKPNSPVKKFPNVSKIRSLDSDLKQVSPSPDKIKRQLEALIQINKDEHTEPWNMVSKPPKLPMEMTVMPSFCGYNKNEDINCSSTCDLQSQSSRKNDEGDHCSSSRMRTAAKKRLGAPNKICQAPEFLSNALGPTLDVSIIDNLKMMRDIFKCDSAKGEGLISRGDTPRRVTHMSPGIEVRLQQSEEEMACRIQCLQKTIEELEEKEQCLLKQIEDEEQERETKRKAFEEEERKLCHLKANLQTMVEEKGIDCGQKSLPDCAFEEKYENLQNRIAAEEEKLSRLKEQYEAYKRELCDAKNKKEALKRNKSLLDAWDVIASRVCHTRLPSFSKAYNLERKTFQPNDVVEGGHCCLPLQMNQSVPDSGRKSRSRSRCGSQGGPSSMCFQLIGSCVLIPANDSFSLDFGWGSKEKCRIQSQSPAECRKRHEDIPFPIQRDITCGLHQSLKTCSCTQSLKMEGGGSDDDLFRKYAGTPSICKKEACCYTSSLDTSAEVLLRKPPCGKPSSRSKSDTTLRNKNSKIVKVMWAVTRINIFQDNCRTYEVMDATSTPPVCAPAKTEGIFVVKSGQKKNCQTPSKKTCCPNGSGP